MGRLKWLFIAIPILLLASCIVPFVFMFSNAVSDEARETMDGAIVALADNDAEAFRGFLDNSVNTQELNRALPQLMAVVPEGPITECNLRSFSFNENGSGATRVKTSDVTRVCMLAGGLITARFQLVEDANGARITGVNVSRGDTTQNEDEGEDG